MTAAALIALGKRALGWLPYIALGAVVVASYLYGVDVERTRRRADVANLQAKHASEAASAAQLLADAERRERAKEQQFISDMADVVAKHKGADDAAKREIQRLDAAVRDGTVRLRERFTCPSVSADGGAGEAGPAAPGSAGGEARGLRGEDARAFVRAGDEADEVVRQLQLCQAIVRGDRGL